jgi:hypothetical protein
MTMQCKSGAGVRCAPGVHEQDVQAQLGCLPTCPPTACTRSEALRDQYRRFTSNRLRWGLLLEDLDTLAGVLH